MFGALFVWLRDLHIKITEPEVFEELRNMELEKIKIVRDIN